MSGSPGPTRSSRGPRRRTKRGISEVSTGSSPVMRTQLFHAPTVQRPWTSGSQPEGRRFESGWGYARSKGEPGLRNAFVAQRIERLITDQEVGGSNPSEGTAPWSRSTAPRPCGGTGSHAGLRRRCAEARVVHALVGAVGPNPHRAGASTQEEEPIRVGAVSKAAGSGNRLGITTSFLRTTTRDRADVVARRARHMHLAAMGTRHVVRSLGVRIATGRRLGEPCSKVATVPCKHRVAGPTPVLSTNVQHRCNGSRDGLLS